MQPDNNSGTPCKPECALGKGSGLANKLRSPSPDQLVRSWDELVMQTGIADINWLDTNAEMLMQT